MVTNNMKSKFETNLIQLQRKNTGKIDDVNDSGVEELA